MFHIFMSINYTHSSYILMDFIHRRMYHLSLCIYPPTYLSVFVSISISISSLYYYDPQYSGSTPHSVHAHLL